MLSEKRRRDIMGKELSTIQNLLLGQISPDKHLVALSFYYLEQLKNEQAESDILKTNLLTQFESSLSKNEIKSISKKMSDRFRLSDIESLLLALMNHADGSREIGFIWSNQSIIRIASRFFEFNKGVFADFCSGSASMLSYALSKKAKAIKGIEVDSLAYNLSLLRLWLEHKILSDAIIKKDIFSYFQENPYEKYEEIFSEFPFGVRREEDYLFEGVTISKRSDWTYIALVMQQLEKAGRAVVIAPMSIETSKADEEIRHHFIKEGYIKQVIALPAGILSYSSIPLYMLVLSRNNDSIRFTDARDIYSTSGRIKYLTEENIDNILTNEKLNKDVKKNQVLKSKRINPEYHLMPKIQDGLAIAEVADIYRSKAIRKQDMDQYAALENMGMEIIRLSHVRNNKILEGDFIKTAIPGVISLEDLDIIITRAGSSLNVAIYKQIEGMQVFVDENFFVIRAIKEKVDPYYLISFLQSDMGQRYLLSAYTGTTIKRINQKNLSKLQIPQLAKSQEDEIASKTRHYNQEIDRLRFELEKIEKEKEEKLNGWFKNH